MIELGNALADYAAYEASLWPIAVGGLIALAAVSVLVVVIAIKIENKSTSDPVMVAMLSFIFFVISSIFFGIFIGTSKSNHAMEVSADIAAQASEHYGVEIPAEKIGEAWRASADDVVLVNTEHDGVRKSLGVSLDEDEAVLTVFQGNVELEPAK